MKGFVVILAIGVLALAFGGTVLERRINALKREMDELRMQIVDYISEVWEKDK